MAKVTEEKLVEIIEFSDFKPRPTPNGLKGIITIDSKVKLLEYIWEEDHGWTDLREESFSEITVRDDMVSDFVDENMRRKFIREKKKKLKKETYNDLILDLLDDISEDLYNFTSNGI